MKRASPIAIWAALLAVYLVWGSTYLGIRLAVATIPPFLMAACRYLIAGGILYALRRRLGDPPPSFREWRSAGLAGCLLLTLGNGAVAWAEQHVASGMAALIVSSVPLWLVVCSWALPAFRNRGGTAGSRGTRGPGPLALAGVLGGLAGIVVLVGPGLTGLAAPIQPSALAVLLFGTITWAVGSLYSRDAILPASPLMGTAAEMLAGGAGLLVLGTVSGQWNQLHIGQISTTSLLSLAYLVVFGSWVGFSAYVWLLRVAPTSLVATYAYVNPIVALFLGHLVAAEPVGYRTLLAAAIIIGSVMVTKLGTTAQDKPETGAEQVGG